MTIPSTPSRPAHAAFRRSALAAASLAALLVAACASGPAPNARLDQARSDYAAASSDPQVVRNAPADLRRAQEALQQAEAAQRDQKETTTVDHFAYLATQRVNSARQASQLAQAEQSVAQAGEERNRIVLDARTREADAQRAQAEMQKAQAEMQRAQADQARRQAVASTNRANALESQLADLNAKQTQRGLVLTLGDVLFDSGRAALNPGAGRTVDQLATFLKANPDRTVQIEGYTDSTGSSSLNQTLSEQRANSVKNALMDRGIGNERVSARGFGPSNPVATNGTEAGRQQNRRIEILISNTAS